MQTTSSERIRSMVVTAMFCALAYLVMFVIHFKVGFLTFDLKDAVLTVLTLLYGPVYGIISVAVVAFLEFITVSDTGLYGLIMNFLASAAFVSAAGLVYRFKRNFKGAVLSMVAAVTAMVGVMLLANCLITPFYLNMPYKEVAAMIPTLLFPFNLCKGMMNAASVLVLYKPLISALRRTGLVHISAPASYSGKRTVILTIAAVSLMAVSLAVVILVLGGTAQWF